MMPTNDERREVARRLRGQAKKLGPNMDAPEFAHYTADVIDVNECMTWYEMELRLADLIEPSDRNDELCAHCDYCGYCDLPKCSEQDGYSFKPKGYVDLMVLADKTIRSARHDMEICGDTVPAWYAAGRLEAVARSIREILGVES